MELIVVSVCALVAFAIVGLAVWAQRNPRSVPREDASTEREWDKAIR